MASDAAIYFSVIAAAGYRAAFDFAAASMASPRTDTLALSRAYIAPRPCRAGAAMTFSYDAEGVERHGHCFRRRQLATEDAMSARRLWRCVTFAAGYFASAMRCRWRWRFGAIDDHAFALLPPRRSRPPAAPGLPAYGGTLSACRGRLVPSVDTLIIATCFGRDVEAEQIHRVGTLDRRRLIAR